MLIDDCELLEATELTLDDDELLLEDTELTLDAELLECVLTLVELLLAVLVAVEPEPEPPHGQLML